MVEIGCGAEMPMRRQNLPGGSCASINAAREEQMTTARAL
jgi:hypothetical protein